MTWIISVCVLVISVCMSNGTVFHIEAENFVTDKFALHRLNATGEESINFNQGQFIHVYFCLRAESEVAVDNILYSNDGGSDMFEVSIDGVKLGEIVTPEHSQNGLLWNNFLYSKQVGPSLTLSSGYHVITINFTSTDFYGVEIDSIFVRVEDRFLEEELFKCSLFCLKDNLYDNGPTRDDLPSITLTRKNYDIDCPKEDNIILPMYHRNVELYMISALLPRYRSFENHRESHHETCVPPSDELWNFQNFVVPIAKEDGEGVLIHNLASLAYHMMNNSHTTVLCVAFDKDPSTPAAIDEGDVDNGHVLSVQFKRVYSPFYVTVRYRGVQSNWSAEFAKYFTPQVRQDIWTISEHEWSTTEVNEVEITIVSDPNNPFPIAIDYLRLTKRRLGERQHKLIYSSKDIQAEVVTVDFGPNAQEFRDKMSITRLDSGEKWESVSYISVLHILPWSQKYGEVLRLYQSGKMRILPLTPPGLDKLPFGSSFIVGQSDPSDRFPRAPISHIEIDPGALQLFITYKDEGKANMIIKPSLHGTRVIVKDVEMARDPTQSPFVTFSSMWITDGNSEVDHLSSNGNDVRHIVNGWRKLYGTAFTFMKKCISKHNTQGPDMRLELLTKKELYQYV